MELKGYHRRQLTPLLGGLRTYNCLFTNKPNIVVDLFKEEQGLLAGVYMAYQSIAIAVPTFIILKGLETLVTQ